MKLILRCTLAIVAIFACVIFIKRNDTVMAQTYGDSCVTEENTCLANGGGSASCTSQYNNCLKVRQSNCATNSTPYCSVNYNDSGHACVATCNPTGGCPNPPPACPNPICQYLGGNAYYWTCNSPIIVDVEGSGFHLTSAAGGVLFDFSGSGHKEQVAWTDPKYGNAWLALDRNGNGRIDDATELFGNFTPQPQTAAPNGFLALSVYDSPAYGGNDDGYITKDDQIYSQLLLWTDTNHNGISEPNELRTLAEAGITSISLNYRQGTRADEYGNIFRYRSHVKMASPSNYDHLIYDVYLAGAN
jgi:hypothetical protein